MIGKYLDSSDARESLARAEVAFKKARAINPELPLAHKLYAQLEVDLGRAHDATARLLKRARTADPELFAGLVSACRYCGLLEASVAADAHARRLEPRVRTSVVHTRFLLADYSHVADTRLEENPCIVALSLDTLGRRDEAIVAVRHLEEKTRTRMRDFMIAARALMEGNIPESAAAIDRIVGSDFRDPEGLFYLTRHLARINELDRAGELFARVVPGGFFCFAAMARDPWLDPLRGRPAFDRLLRQARTRYCEAEATFTREQGDVMLGVAPSKARESTR